MFDKMKQIINLRIFIFGFRGFGIEIAKNLILAGPNEKIIYDKNICCINDLSSNFLLKKLMLHLIYF